MSTLQISDVDVLELTITTEMFARWRGRAAVSGEWGRVHLYKYNKQKRYSLDLPVQKNLYLINGLNS
jgi:hypothetical protein